jgi:hypothetical protein
MNSQSNKAPTVSRTIVSNFPVKPRLAGAWTCRKRHAIYFARWASQ